MNLTPEEAGELIGVPPVMLERWAFLGEGPKNIGTKYKPRYTEDDLMDWLTGVTVRKATTGIIKNG